MMKILSTLPLLGLLAVTASAQSFPPSDPKAEAKAEHRSEMETAYLTWDFQLAPLRDAAIGLVVASGLAAALAFRPRRRGTPERSMAVVQTQIILAMVGAVVMIVVGTSLARAFGIVGAAGLVRYRAKVADPKDAGVMLSTLAIGLASGVGLYLLAAFVTVFILGALWLLESNEPEKYAMFDLKVKAKDSASLRPKIEETLRRNHVRYELRTATAEEMCYEVKVPPQQTTDALSNLLLSLGPPKGIEVQWETKKDKVA
jgi:hypothetical protein